MTVFPGLVERRTFVKDAFNISVTASYSVGGHHDGYRAILTYRESEIEAIVAEGPYGSTVEAALRKLLDVLAEALATTNPVRWSGEAKDKLNLGGGTIACSWTAAPRIIPANDDDDLYD